MDHHNNYMLALHFKTRVIRLRNQQKTITDVARICGITPFQVSYIMYLLPDVAVQCLNLQMSNSLVAALLGLTEAEVATIHSNMRASMDGSHEE